VQISAILAVGRAVTPAPLEQTAASRTDAWVSPHPDEGAVTPITDPVKAATPTASGLFPMD